MLTTRIRACLLAVALVAGACAGDDDASPDVTVDPTATTAAVEDPPETTTTTADPRVAVEQAFYDQWDAYLEIVGDPDVSNPLIELTYTGTARDGVIDGISALREAGTAIRRPDDPQLFTPRIVETRRVSATEYLVFECTIQGLVLFEREAGTVLDDAVANYERKNTLVLDDQAWKVSDTVRVEVGEPGCDDLPS